MPLIAIRRRACGRYIACWGFLRTCLDGLPDTRRGLTITYGMASIGMAASVVFSQSLSFLTHQRLFEVAHGRSNAASLFGIAKLPTRYSLRQSCDAALRDSSDGLAVSWLISRSSGEERWLPE